MLDLLGRGGLGHVHGLADRARDERLDRAHHPDVAHVVDGPRAVGRLEGAVEDREVLGLDVRGAFDRLVLGQVVEDLAGLVGGVAELLERGRDGLVDDLEEALADQLLVLDERDVRLDAGRIAIHHEGDGAGGREHGDLRVAVAVLLAELERLVVDGRGVLDAGWPGTPSVGIRYAASRCLPMTRRNGSSLILYSANGPPWSRAMIADCLYASPCMIAVRAAA